VAIGWRWAHEALGPWPGLVAAIVLALSPLAVANAREARMYALESALSAAAWWLTWRLLSGRVAARGPLAVHGLFLALAVAGELWTMALGLALACLQGVVALGALLADRRRSGAAAALLAICLGGLAFLPWLPALFAVATNGQAYWTPTPGVLDWTVSLGTALLGWREELPLFLSLRVLLLAIVASGAVALVFERDRARRTLGWCLLAGLAVPLALWAISQFRSIYDTRYLGPVVAPLALAIAAGFQLAFAILRARAAGRRVPAGRRRLPPGRRFAGEEVAVGAAALLAIGLLLAGPMGIALGLWLDEWRSERGLAPTQGFVVALRPRLGPGDVVISLDARSYFPLAYAAHRLAEAGEPLPAPVFDWDSGREPFYRGQSLIPPGRVLDAADVEEAGGWGRLPGLGRGSSIWLAILARGRDEPLGFAPLAEGELEEVARIVVAPVGQAAEARQLVPTGGEGSEAVRMGGG
jgi:hypothetical protein